MKIIALRRSPRFRQNAQRLVLPLSVITACLSTADSFPAPGKFWRPVLAAQIAATWIAVAVAVVVEVRNRRKSAASQPASIQEPQTP